MPHVSRPAESRGRGAVCAPGFPARYDREPELGPEDTLRATLIHVKRLCAAQVRSASLRTVDQAAVPRRPRFTWDQRPREHQECGEERGPLTWRAEMPCAGDDKDAVRWPLAGGHHSGHARHQAWGFTWNSAPPQR